MNPTNKSSLLVKGTAVAVLSLQADDYISLTDIAKHKEPDRADQVIRNWMRNRNTVEFLGIWENLNNPDLKPLEFEGFRNRAGLNSFVLTPRQWIESTAAVGLISKSGRNGGTFAHKDIAFEFASWISVEDAARQLLANRPFNDSDTAQRACAFLQSEAIMQLMNGTKDNPRNPSLRCH